MWAMDTQSQTVSVSNTEIRFRERAADGSMQEQTKVIGIDCGEAQRLYGLGEVGDVHLQDRRDGDIRVVRRADVISFRPTAAEPDPMPSTVRALRLSRAAKRPR